MAGVYVHIPFCKSFCIYCDFFSVLDRGSVGAYVDALLKESELRKDFFKAEKVMPATLYFGGGTPSLLSGEQLKIISDKIIQVFFAGKCPIEFTVEVNPDDITPQYAEALKCAGANRISMGVQSFDDRNLKWMCRRHTSAGAEEAFYILRRAGFDNISLDLIFGYAAPGAEDMMASWHRDLDKITELRPEHISAYQMSIEPGSTLGQMASKYEEPAQEFCSEQYSLLQKILSEAGYEQYEISNFSLPGKKSLHNSSYWEREPYIGLGAAAHSFKGRTRSWNPSDIGRYISLSENDVLSESLSDEEIEEETLMLGLRKVSGIPYREIKNLKKLEKRGLLIVENGNIRIPQDKLFISDYIIGLIG